MKFDKKIGSVYQTDNLDQFKYLDSNRELRDRVSRVKKSIREFGWINNPIVCNEKMEVIDGQARLQACRELGIGLTYIIIPSLGIKECRVLNSISANWTSDDYIMSYANSGYTDYKYLEQVVRKMRREWGKRHVNIFRQMILDSSAEKLIKAGTIKFSEAEYNTATKHITWVAQFNDVLAANKLDSAKMYEGLYFAARKLPADKKEKLPQKFERKLDGLRYATPGSVKDAIAIIDDISNYKVSQSEKFYLFHIYEKEGLYSG